MSVSYEIMSQKLGKWSSDSVSTDKEDAISGAEETLARGKVEAVKVIEETVDETTGDARDRVVFNKSRDAPSKQKSTGDKKEKKSSNKKSSGKAKKKSRHSLGDLLVIIFLGTFSVVSSVAFVICFMSK
ncbi:MAG: hypothetical protein HOL37_01290 [Rhodospirillaceae bacterium]|jgi:hypothetical protein|nr:hypothetical protein [Rhodospirillaceae bacterium]MBT4219332.1 hypothetical protein [Rhodospirillaceae bacterium]MBT5307946.1 hypothetical protein [Rhodospirillaceae bacterium]MBT7355781.1 hypothetical protein [Rhodospirillaceae bacterium]